MYEFVIMYKVTGENDMLYGRDFPDALHDFHHGQILPIVEGWKK